MKLVNKKYFFFDIDGTLMVQKLGQRSIPESTKFALQQLKGQGHFLAIATGRSYALAKDVMEELEIENMVSDGGNGLTINGELLGIDPLNYEDCIALIQECIEKGLPWGVSVDNSKVRLTPDSRFLEMTRDKYMDTRVDENLDLTKMNQIFKVYVACEPNVEKQLETLEKLPWCRFHDEYIFVEPGDKAQGIYKVLEHFGGAVEDVVVFGDEKNDLTMFREEWLSIAMGNAVDELKEKANYITDDVDKDGILKACQYFGWLEKADILE